MSKKNITLFALLLCLYITNSKAFWSQTTQEVAKDTISFAAVGDIMMGTTWPEGASLPPNDGADMLKEVTPILSKTDITFGNLEGPMLEGGKTSKCGSKSKNCYAFRVPTRYGKHLKDAGFDLISLANNHANDFGAFGMESSQKVLDELGLIHSGPVGSVGNLTVNNKKISLIAFATNAVSYNLNDVETAKRVVAETVKKSDIVVVSFHGGAEGEAHQNVPNGREIYLGEERGDLRKFSHAVIDSGADLVIGHGPHVVRGIEVYKDRLIAYSLGNFATYGAFNLTGAKGLSLVLEVSINNEGKFLSGKIHPLKQEKPGGPKIDPEKQVISVVKSLSTQDFGTTSIKVAEDGTLSFP
ncbi:MAG: CapA family protein [Acidobacteria bacterium]|nr:CapA family protein [Acidobacteriota bacterium]